MKKNNSTMRLKFLGILLSQLFILALSAQKTDTFQFLTIHDVLENINKHHPITYSSFLQLQYAKANQQRASGNFDPVIQYDFKQKTLDNKKYYQNQFFEVDFNTKSPITPLIGYENNNGTYINPESITGNSGLSYVGFEFSALKNLITDQRRTALKQAKVFQVQSEIVQRQIIQNLHLNIWNQYISWYVFEEQKNILSSSIALSNDRQIAIRKLFVAGGCSGFDTLETSVQLNQFVTKQKEVAIYSVKTKILFTAHLWNSVKTNQEIEFTPISIKSNILPSNKFFEQLETKFLAQLENTDSFISNQPDLQIYFQKNNSLKLDIQLKQSYVLPKLDLKYQYLNKDILPINGSSALDNHRFGVSFSTPLYFRTSRGELKTAKLKLLENQFETTLKQREIETKLLALKKQTLAFKEILDMLKNVETGYYQLYQMEIKKFESGDGTIFLLNSRETKYLEAKLKTIEQYGKYMISLTEYFRILGTIQSVIS